MSKAVKISLKARVTHSVCPSLWMIRCTHAGLCARKVKKLLPYSACKNMFFVRHQILGKTMQFVDISNKSMPHFKAKKVIVT
jgi:hypothetical protein